MKVVMCRDSSSRIELHLGRIDCSAVLGEPQLGHMFRKNYNYNAQWVPKAFDAELGLIGPTQM